MKNRHGLTRYIPSPIKWEIRVRSKFGCVICRAGIYDYEHIDPEYSDATAHDPDSICCLCTACHAKVTRGHYSKDFVRRKYKEVEAADPANLLPPFDYLDFHDGKAELKVGGISYGRGINSIVKYHGKDVFSITPSSDEGVAGINAVFLDEDGLETLRIIDNVWHGALTAWDTEVVGPRVMVRRRAGAFSLVLRLEPPGKIVIEKLDMRIADAHILASEHSHALGRYISDGSINWAHASIVCMENPLDEPAAIEFLTPFEAEWRDLKWKGHGNRCESPDNNIVMQSGLGVANKRMGIIVGANCLTFGAGQLACGGPRPLPILRRLVFDNPTKVAKYIGTGAL
jgi:hypothetical protein